MQVIVRDVLGSNAKNVFTFCAAAGDEPASGAAAEPTVPERRAGEGAAGLEQRVVERRVLPQFPVDPHAARAAAQRSVRRSLATLSEHFPAGHVTCCFPATRSCNLHTHAWGRHAGRLQTFEIVHHWVSQVRRHWPRCTAWC